MLPHYFRRAMLFGNPHSANFIITSSFDLGGFFNLSTWMSIAFNDFALLRLIRFIINSSGCACFADTVKKIKSLIQENDFPNVKFSKAVQATSSYKLNIKELKWSLLWTFKRKYIHKATRLMTAIEIKSALYKHVTFVLFFTLYKMVLHPNYAYKHYSFTAK